MKLNKKLVNRICKRCNEIYSTTSSHSKYCGDCRKIRDIEINKKSREKHKEKRNAYKKRYYEKRGMTTHRELNRIDKCICCDELKRIDSRNMCHNCYEKWRLLNNKLRDMTESEKRDYLIKRGLLDKELSVEDLKKDLGVI